MQLPPLLQPWAAWLSLFPADIVNHVGELLLRLNPLLTPLKRHAARLAHDPAGVGDIVQRGSYNRLLISEWAYADAVPDEFIRRAANGELLFTGPEPANSDEPLCSIALFDAGPYQLGEPRLVHIAMFILLARRAELAGAAFKWGILQRPDILFTVQGAEAIQHLLNVRTLSTVDAVGLGAWGQAIGERATDCWLIGDARSPRPPHVRSQVTISRAWLTGQLEVTLAQRRSSRTVALAVPASADGVRLLRKPFEAVAPATAAGIAASGAHSLKHAPYFSTQRQWLAVGMIDGTFSLYHIPDSINSKPGRPRKKQGHKLSQATVAAGVFGKHVGTISRLGENLYCSGFPGEFFSKGHPAAPMPVTNEMQLIAGTARWASAFYLRHKLGQGAITERVYALDKRGILMCWTRTGKSTQAAPVASVHQVSNSVIGAYQDRERLLFAETQKDRTDIYQVVSMEGTRTHLFPLMHKGVRLLFGQVEHWRAGGGLFALQTEDGRWLVGDRGGAEYVTVAADVEVLGVGFSEVHNVRGLVVLNQGRRRIELLGNEKRHVLVESGEKIAKASYDPARNRLAWLGQSSGALTVRGVDQKPPFLQTIPMGEQHER